jgi:hypothetical protein
MTEYQAVPTNTPDRIPALDALRGFAVLGILIMNVQRPVPARGWRESGVVCRDARAPVGRQADVVAGGVRQALEDEHGRLACHRGSNRGAKRQRLDRQTSGEG